MIPYTFIQREPVYWKQSPHTERGSGFNVNTRLSRGYGSILISGAGNVGGMRTDLSFVRGAYDWKIPEGPSGSLGFLAYHPVDEHCDSAFIGGGCSITEDIYDDAWHRVRNGIYDGCTISLEVVPIEYDGEDALWNREVNKFIYIQQVELAFVRMEKVKEEAPPPKRGLFG
jgi:hypothetical protein